MTDAFLLPLGALAVIGVVFVARYLDGQAWSRSLLALELRIPVGLMVDAVNRWLNTVAAATHPPRLSLLPGAPVVLEVVANASGIRHVLLVPKHLRATILAGLRAALPGVRLEELPGYLASRPRCLIGIEAVLSNQRRQLSVERAEGTATALLATLQPLAEGQTVIVQWIITGAGTPAPVRIAPGRREAIPARPASRDDPMDGEALHSARRKDTDALLHASLRIGVQAAKLNQARAILARVFSQYRASMLRACC